MLGYLYLLLCFAAGWAICSYALPDLGKIAETAYDKRRISISPYMVLLPVWFFTGVLALTWAAYIIASLCSGAESPLAVADAIIMPVALGFFLLTFYLKGIRKKLIVPVFFCKDNRSRIMEILLVAGILLLAVTLMFTTFYVKDGKLFIGVSVFSDFSPHIGMIRSFSYGNNFPTSYSHYAGEDIKYHFMFQFLAGNLELLGMRIDYAFNIPSILSFLSAFLLLYVLAVKITGKPAAGVLSCLLFAFRSSASFFTYLAGLPKGESIIKILKDNTAFIGDTPHEDWGLWNLNVYCNQRHLAFGLSVLLFLLILFLPHLYDMFETVKRLYLQKITEHKKKNNKRSSDKKYRRKDILSFFKLIFLSKEGWQVKEYRLPIVSGIMLGSLSFFHGAAVIGCLLVLFMIAVLSKRRLEFVITAVIAIALSYLQTRYFIQGSAISAQYFFGFIAENKTLFGVVSYLGRLLGILPFVILTAFCLEKGTGRYLILAFTAPLVFAFTVSLTVDVTVNHKYIMMSCILLGIFAAALLVRLFERKDLWIRLIGVLVLATLTSTGIYDFYTVINKNRTEGGISLDMEDPLTEFIRDNSDSQDLFLTAGTYYTINQVVFGGAMLYQGHQYYAWSAGYDTASRDIMVRGMYEAGTPKELDDLVKANAIRFIVVEKANRESEDYTVNEGNIRSTYECVYEEGEGTDKTSIYDMDKPLY